MVDRTVKRLWTIDLSAAGKVPPSPPHPPEKAQRQTIVRFEGSVDGEERFPYWLTFPEPDSEPDEAPSQAQYDTVNDFYGEGPVSRGQAGYLISAWYHAIDCITAQRFKFSAPRRKLIQVAVSAYILSHPELRREVRRLSQSSYAQGKSVLVERTQAFQPAMQFASDLIADMRGDGALVFG